MAISARPILGEALRREGMSVCYEHDKLAAVLNETFIDAGREYRVADGEAPDADVG